MNRKRLSPIFLILGLVFFAVGWATNQDAFTYAAIALLVIALFTNSRLFRKK
jgi:hypothetical protein